MLADIFAQPFELTLLFPARRLAAKVLVSRFELLFEEQQRIAQRVTGHGDVEIWCGSDEDPIAEWRDRNGNWLDQRMARQLVDDQLDAVSLTGGRPALLGRRLFTFIFWCRRRR